METEDVIIAVNGVYMLGDIQVKNIGFIDERPMTAGQILALIFCSAVSGTLSLCGSISIICALRKKLRETFARLMVGLSAADVIATLALINMGWALPHDVDSPFAVGTTETCTVAGFFFVFIVGSALYSACVSFYFLLTVKYARRDFSVWEPLFHTVSLGTPLALGVAGVVLEGFNVPQIGQLCTFSTGPPSCRRAIENHPEFKPSCTRGKYTNELGGTLAACLLLSALLGIINTVILYRNIRRTHANSRRHSFQNQLSNSAETRARDSLKQSALYVASYVNGFLWLTLGALLILVLPYDTTRNQSQPAMFIPILFQTLFVPLQGFFNAFVFFRPRVQHWAKLFPERSTFWCWQQVVTARTAPRRRLSSTGSFQVPNLDGTTISGIARRSSSWQLSLFNKVTVADNVETAEVPEDPTGDETQHGPSENT